MSREWSAEFFIHELSNNTTGTDFLGALLLGLLGAVGVAVETVGWAAAGAAGGCWGCCIWYVALVPLVSAIPGSSGLGGGEPRIRDSWGVVAGGWG
jgi:hypothetical protein